MIRADSGTLGNHQQWPAKQLLLVVLALMLGVAGLHAFLSSMGRSAQVPPPPRFCLNGGTTAEAGRVAIGQAVGAGHQEVVFMNPSTGAMTAFQFTLQEGRQVVRCLFTEGAGRNYLMRVLPSSVPFSGYNADMFPIDLGAAKTVAYPATSFEGLVMSNRGADMFSMGRILTSEHLIRASPQSVIKWPEGMRWQQAHDVTLRQQGIIGRGCR